MRIEKFSLSVFCELTQPSAIQVFQLYPHWQWTGLCRMKHLWVVYLKDTLLETHVEYIYPFSNLSSAGWYPAILVCVVIQHVPVCVNLNHVLEFSVDDEVGRVGQLLSKMKLNAKVALFYKLKMITGAVVWGQVKTERCVTRAIIASVYLVAESWQSFPPP